MPIISIQSSVAYGHVGNSAAIFAIQRLGIEAWPVHTVQLSNHTGYPDWGGGALGADHVSEVLAGLERRGGLAQTDALLSGYAGTADLVEAIADCADRLKSVNSAALFCCDPGLGHDAKGLFVSEDVAHAVKTRLLSRSDIATPNRFELSHLTCRPVETLDQARAAADVLADAGPQRIVVSSIPTETGVGVLAREGDVVWLIETPRLNAAANGAGDCLTAMLLARLVGGAPFETAVAQAVSSIYGLLSRGSDELPLVSAQDEIVAPSRVFQARRLN